MTYLIVVEGEGADGSIYHYQPYRLASSLDEAKELMRDYLSLTGSVLLPNYFALYQERNGEFAYAEYYDPLSQTLADATTWLQATGRC